MLTTHSLVNSSEFLCRLTPVWGFQSAFLDLWHWTFPNPPVPCGSWEMCLLENTIQSLMSKITELVLLFPKIRPVFVSILKL